jgi:hypothetical protein
MNVENVRWLSFSRAASGSTFVFGEGDGGGESEGGKQHDSDESEVVDEKKKKKTRQKKPKQLKWEMHGRKDTKARGMNADAALEDEVATNSFSFDGANALLPAEPFPFPQAGRISGPNVVRVYFFNTDGMSEKGALYEEIRSLRPDVVFLLDHRGSRGRGEMHDIHAHSGDGR